MDKNKIKLFLCVCVILSLRNMHVALIFNWKFIDNFRSPGKTEYTYINH